MLLASCLLCLQAATARGGGGPENVFLVVNSESWASRTIANHYAAWRGVPAGNIFLLKWTDGFVSVDVEQFRKAILRPVLNKIEKRQLSGQIDYIVYSSDFPFAVSLAGDFPGVDTKRRHVRYASITGLTYLADLVKAGNTQYVQSTANYYMQRGAAGEGTRAFRRSQGWEAGGLPSTAAGRRYYLSTMLAVTSGRGNTISEALRYLRRSALADGTHPPGTIYFVKNKDVRSVTRHQNGAFDTTVRQLRRLGVRAETVEGNVPMRKRDVQGAMIGTVHLNWPKSGSRILPGAICEHLTSFGGVMDESLKKTRQSRLSELLRHGATAASGTVSEPTANPTKFPSPTMHVHYARGSTVAEAFYQSVAGPFQLLIVGDPLCRPWATIPLVSVAGVEAGAEVSGQLNLRPTARLARDQRIDHYELFVDGRRRARGGPGGALRFDTTTLPDGHHELRVVAIESSPIRSQGRVIVPVIVNNHNRSCRLTSTRAAKIRWGQPLRLTIWAPGAAHIRLVQSGEIIRQIDGAGGNVTIDVRQFGYGPLRLVAESFAAGGTIPLAISAPLDIEILPSRPLAAIKPRRGVQLESGLQLRLPSGKRVAVDDTTSRSWLSAAGVKEGQTYVLSAYFEVADEGVYQIQARQNGGLKVTIDGRLVFSSENENFTQRYIPFSLARGLHQIDIQGRPERSVLAKFRFGGYASDSAAKSKGSQPLSGKAGFLRPK